MPSSSPIPFTCPPPSAISIPVPPPVKPTADSLAEFAKLAESGTITRSQFETFAYHAVNSPLPNENFTDLNALADTLRKALDEGTQIIL